MKDAYGQIFGFINGNYIDGSERKIRMLIN